MRCVAYLLAGAAFAALYKQQRQQQQQLQFEQSMAMGLLTCLCMADEVCCILFVKANSLPIHC
jgi:hypothetical protein